MSSGGLTSNTGRMSGFETALRRNASKLVAALVILALYAAARLPELPDAERLKLASPFEFTSFALAEWQGAGH